MFHSASPLRTFGLYLVCLALFAMMGGHWTVLQGTAWGNMLVTYSIRSGSLAEGVKQTFNGKNRCSLCKTVAEGQEKDQPERVSPEKGVAIANRESDNAETAALSCWVACQYPPGPVASCPLRTTLPPRAGAHRPPLPKLSGMRLSALKPFKHL